MTVKMEMLGVPLQPMEMEACNIGIIVIQKVGINYLYEKVGENTKFVCLLL